jgi:hypothetical protein
MENYKKSRGIKMKHMLLFLLLALLLSSCASLNSTRALESRKYRVFVVNKQPTRCEYISSVQGIGTEEFEGDREYTVPLAMTDIKRNTAYAGGNVVFIQSSFDNGNSYVVKGLCYKCRTVTRSKYRRRKRRAGTY